MSSARSNTLSCRVLADPGSAATVGSGTLLSPPVHLHASIACTHVAMCPQEIDHRGTTQAGNAAGAVVMFPALRYPVNKHQYVLAEQKCILSFGWGSDQASCETSGQSDVPYPPRRFCLHCIRATLN